MKTTKGIKGTIITGRREEFRFRFYFAILPVNTFSETRWLKFVNVLELHISRWIISDRYWTPTKFIDFPLSRENAWELRRSGFVAQEGDTKEDFMTNTI